MDSLFGIDNGRVKGTPILEAIITRVHDRQDKWPTTILRELPEPTSLHEDAIIGSFSYCLQSSRRRLLKAECLIAVDGTSETPPALARDYLTLRHVRAAPIRPEQRTRLKECIRPLPIYARPARSPEGFYVDIIAAYWQIMRVVGWQVDYYPGRWLQRGPGVRDFPWRSEAPEQKLARNSLVSAARNSPIPRWVDADQTIREMVVGSRLINDQLTTLVRDVLHAVAVEIRVVGAAYVATDGYILLDHKSMIRAREVLDAWGLRCRIRGFGRTEVYGVGSYDCGKLRTKAREREPTETSNITPGEYDAWLQPRFAALAACADHDD